MRPVYLCLMIASPGLISCKDMSVEICHVTNLVAYKLQCQYQGARIIEVLMLIIMGHWLISLTDSIYAKLFSQSTQCCRVNWKPAKSSSSVQSGDVISCAGKGRVEVGEVVLTKKGRYSVELMRYL